MFQVSALSLHSEPSWDIIFNQVPFTCVLLPPFWPGTSPDHVPAAHKVFWSIILASMTGINTFQAYV